MTMTSGHTFPSPTTSLVTAALAATSLLGKPAFGQLTSEQLLEDVVRYAEIGDHRTAHHGDLLTTQWIAQELEIAGFEVEVQSWSLRQFFLTRATVTAGESQIEAFPLWLPQATSEPVQGSLRRFQAGSDMSRQIALVRIGFRDTDVVEAPLDSGAAGVIAINDIGFLPVPWIFAHNSEPPRNREPYPAPVLVVPRAFDGLLSNVANVEGEVSLETTGENYPDAVAHNVVGHIRRGEQLVVISTPQSAWFNAAGERGPGVALLLGLARWISSQKLDLSFLFLAASGHELGFLGMQHFMENTAPPREQVVAWIHLGSSIATRAWTLQGEQWNLLDSPSPFLFLVSSPDLLANVESHLGHLPGYAPRSDEARGELGSILERGYSAFGFFGAHLFFHSPLDRPDAVSADNLAAVAQGLASLIETMNPMEASFLRGDCNDDGKVDISDAVCILEWLFLGSETPGCVAALNTNGDGEVDIADPVYSLWFSFLGGPGPVEPYPECGPGTLPTDEEMGCEAAKSCSQ